MKIIILGAGQVGSTLCENLCDENDITLIDTQDKLLAPLQNRLDIRTLIGSASQPNILEEAGCEDADMVIAVTSSDECNIVACQIAHSIFKVPTKIARVRSLSLARYPEIFTPEHIPIDTIINPAKLITKRLKRMIEHPGAITVLDFADNKVQLASVRAMPPCRLLGKSLTELKKDTENLHITFAGIMRDNQMFIPTEDTIIKPFDEIFFFACREDVQTTIQALLKNEPVYENIMIAGAGNIGMYLSGILEKQHNVKLLDVDPQRCEIAAGELDKTIVLTGDAADTDLLQSENIEDIDLFCAITNDDEANIMSAVLAKRLGAKHTIALVNRQTYARYLIERSPDVDIAVSPQKITGGHILRYLRKGDMANVHPLPRGSAEALEVIVHGNNKTSKVTGKKIKQLKLPKETIIGAIMRDGEIIMPTGDTVIAENDHVILMVCKKNNINATEKLFQVTASFL